MPRSAKYNPRTEEVKQKISEKLRGRKRSEEVKQKISLTLKGRAQPSKKEIAYKMGKANIGRKHTEEWKSKISNKLKGHPHYGPFTHSSKTKKKMSDAKKGKVWSDEHRKKAYKALAIRPNYKEIYLTNLLKSLFQDEYKYVGDGQSWIGGKNPDWMNINGKKKLIEFFGRNWHKPEDEQLRTNHFKQFGFNCLIIWSEELKNEVGLKEKLEGFHNAS